MKNQKSITKNYIYNLSLTMLNMFFPLITAPYVSRVLGADNLGKVNFATAVSTWFLIIASFGIPVYGIREIARVREDREKLNKVFSELILIQIAFSVLAAFLYIIIIFSYDKFRSEISVFLVMTLTILLNTLSIDWFYQGIEEYGYITFRSAVLKVISVVLIFALVRQKNNYVTLAVINVFALSFGNMLNYVHSRKYASINFRNLKIKNHIIKLRTFFFSALIISIYTQLDQVILGIFSNTTAIAFYNRSKQVTAIGISLTASLSTVLIPRVSYLYENDRVKYKSMLAKAIDFNYIIAIPCITGIILLSKEIMWLFGGNEFIVAAPTLIITSFTIIIVSFGGWQFNQVLLPLGKEKTGVIIQALMALISLILNFILIPRFTYIGAGAALTITEFIGTFIGCIIAKKIVNVRYITKSLVKFIISSAIMSVVIIIVKYFITNYLLIILISLVVSPIAYALGLIILKEEIILDIIHQFSNKLKKPIK